jgi:signal transduction histidine kinase
MVKHSRRLRWQLTVSHLIAVAFTLLSMVAAAVLLVALVLRPHFAPPDVPAFGVSRALAFFGAASVAVLLGSSLFALVSSSVVAYLLARRVTRRLERLGAAAQALAAGDLDARVNERFDDELGQLAARFNQMAADLQHTWTELRAERDRVAGLLSSRRELVASVSHELRTPVTVVRGYLESTLAREAGVSEELRRDLKIIQAEITRLEHLIDDLFTLARADVGRLELRLESTDVAQVARQQVATFGPLAWNQRKVQVVAEPAASASQARTDVDRLRQVLANLLTNAIRHTPPGGLVGVSLALEDGQVRLDVRDTGGGISAEDLPHVFERFYRGHDDQDREGSGLGLAVARDLVEAMGGSLEASSVSGEGSTFTVRLPRA